jgi:hypothetical protein
MQNKTLLFRVFAVRLENGLPYHLVCNFLSLSYSLLSSRLGKGRGKGKGKGKEEHNITI